jgi:hypothetical protein
LHYHGEVKDRPLRVLGYVRVSTIEQAESGLGIAAQEAAIRSECDRRGWDLMEVVADEGESGKSLDRPGLQFVLTRIANGEADGLVAAKLDRIARRSRASPTPRSSQMTTVLAPISMSESSPNPASATERAWMAATARTHTPTTFQARVVASSR